VWYGRRPGGHGPVGWMCLRHARSSGSGHDDAGGVSRKQSQSSKCSVSGKCRVRVVSRVSCSRASIGGSRVSRVSRVSRAPGPSALGTGIQLGEPSTIRFELFVGSGHSRDGSTSGLGSMPTGLPTAGLVSSAGVAAVACIAALPQHACLPQWQSSHSVRGWPQQARL
jgi:hypothetical protein